MGTALWSSWRRSRRAPRPRTGAGGAGRHLSGVALQSSGCQRQGCHAPMRSKCTCVCMYGTLRVQSTSPTHYVARNV